LTNGGFYDNIYKNKTIQEEGLEMERIKTLSSRDLEASAKTGGCGECQTSCQSASKTSCSVANQQCEKCKESK
jgi:predicted ribosomally synthesized six-cysteine peptide SCIFF